MFLLTQYNCDRVAGLRGIYNNQLIVRNVHPLQQTAVTEQENRLNVGL